MRKRKTSFTVKATVKRLALEIAKCSGRTNFTRVADSFTNGVEAHVHNLVASAVHRHPGIGKTLKDFNP